jgi:Galactose oxidase, central domain
MARGIRHDDDMRMLSAASRRDQYVCRTVQTVARCTGPLLLAVALVADADPLERVAAGHWYEIPDSEMRKVAVQSPEVARITAWSSAALDPQTNRLLVWGGGHADYAGNEVYAFDLETREWSRLTEPSPPDTGRGDTYADGAPRSRHTYNYIEFVPAAGKLLSFGGASLYPRGGETTRSIAEFDPKTRTWVNGRRHEVPPGGSLIGAHARLDPASGDVFFVPAQRGAPARYSPAEDRWQRGWDTGYVNVHSTAAVDPQRRLMVLIGSGTERPQALSWNLDRPGRATDLRPLTTGHEEIERAYGPGFDFHGPSGKFVAWAGGTSVYVLDPGDWRWARCAAAPGNGADPGPQLSTGTYGRFRYVPRLDLFVLMNGVKRNVFVFRLPPL